MIQTAAGLAVAAAAALAVPEAPSDAGPPAVELAISRDDGLAGRLRAELVAAGFAVTLLDGGQIPSGCEAGDESHPPRARIVVRRAVGGGATGAPTSEVCVLARASGEVVVREVLRGEKADQNADGILAVRVVELLRASLLAPGAARPPDAGRETSPVMRVPPPPAVVEAAASPAAAHSTAPRGLLVDLGVGANANLGAGDISPGLGLTLWWPLRSRAGLGVGVTGPAGAGHLNAGSESADVYVSTVMLGLRYALLGAEAPWTLHAGAGGSALWFNLQGRSASQGHSTNTDNLVVAGPYADLRLSFRVSARVAFYSQVRGTYSVPEPVVAFASRDVARLGRPLLAWTFGIECRPVSSAGRD